MNSELNAALSDLRKLKEKHSLAAMLGMIRTLDGFSDFTKPKLHRWLHYGNSNTIHPATKSEILNVVQGLKAYREAPPQIKCGLIATSTETLPLLLVPHLPKTSIKQNTSVIKSEGIDLILDYSNDTIESLLAALQEGKLDVIAAPRHMQAQISNYPFVRRFLRFVRLCPRIYLPLNSQTERELRSELGAMRNDGKYLGLLPNAGYRSVLTQFLGKELPPRTEPVRGYMKAFEMLEAGKIAGVMGHRLFVENVRSLVDKARKKRGEDVPKAFSRLDIFQENVFDRVRMDIWVNIDRIQPRTARYVFHAVSSGVEYINKNVDSDKTVKHRCKRSFAELLNRLLNLEDAPVQGNAIFDDYKGDYEFGIETFETATLLKLWG